MAQHKFIDKYDLPDAGKRNKKYTVGCLAIIQSVRKIPKMVNFVFLVRLELMNSLMMPIVVKLKCHDASFKIVIIICKNEIMNTHEIMNFLGLIIFEVNFDFFRR